MHLHMRRLELIARETDNMVLPAYRGRMAGDTNIDPGREFLDSARPYRSHFRRNLKDRGRRLIKLLECMRLRTGDQSEGRGLWMVTLIMRQ